MLMMKLHCQLSRACSGPTLLHCCLIVPTASSQLTRLGIFRLLSAESKASFHSCSLGAPPWLVRGGGVGRGRMRFPVVFVESPVNLCLSRVSKAAAITYSHSRNKKHKLLAENRLQDKVLFASAWQKKPVATEFVEVSVVRHATPGHGG